MRVIQNGLVTRGDASKKIDELRAMSPPRGVTVSVGGTPALEQDSIHSLFAKLPLMVVVLILTTTILMFLAFGSLVLPIKAALMSALTLGSTMGILTWMFVDGHGSGLMNYTPQPLMAPMIGLIIAVIWGLSTDYEVFLVSRMVEARARGMSTAEAIRIGTATTGRLITGAALVLAVVAGAFVFSDLVMMKYLAFGLLLALLLDATIVRMFLVPAIMKMLGDDCWWAPQWMKRIQERLGLGDVELPDERKRPTVREPEEALVGAGAPVRQRPPHDPGHPENATRGATGPGRPLPPRVPSRRRRQAPPASPPRQPHRSGRRRPPVSRRPRMRLRALEQPERPTRGRRQPARRGSTPSGLRHRSRHRARGRHAGPRRRGRPRPTARSSRGWVSCAAATAADRLSPQPTRRGRCQGSGRGQCRRSRSTSRPRRSRPNVRGTRKPPRRSTPVRPPTNPSVAAAVSARRICCVGRVGSSPRA